MLGNPADKQAPKKAYGVAQYTEKMTLAQFSEHISEHNCVYDAEDVQAILGKAVKCLREMLIAGKKVELGKLGEFYLTLQGKGAESAAKYNPDIHVDKVNVIWTPSQQFIDLKKEVTFNLVAPRKEQEESVKKSKAQQPGTTDTPDAGGGGSNPSQGTGSNPGSGSGSAGGQGDGDLEL